MAAYLGAAVEGGLAEGAAAQGADGDVVQLLLLAGQAAAAAGAAPAGGLAAEVGADGVAVPLVLAQRHGGGAAPLRPGSPSARPRESDGLHVGSRRRPGTASCRRRRRRRDLPAPASRRPRRLPKSGFEACVKPVAEAISRLFPRRNPGEAGAAAEKKPLCFPRSQEFKVIVLKTLQVMFW